MKLVWAVLMREGFPQALAKAWGQVEQLSLPKCLQWGGREGDLRGSFTEITSR